MKYILTALVALAIAVPSFASTVTMSSGNLVTGDVEDILVAAVLAGENPTLETILGVATAPDNVTLEELTPFAVQILNGQINSVRWTDTRAIFVGASVDIGTCGTAVKTIGDVTGETGIKADVSTGMCVGHVGRFKIMIN
jgi:hypothetical protein